MPSLVTAAGADHVVAMDTIQRDILLPSSHQVLPPPFLPSSPPSLLLVLSRQMLLLPRSTGASSMALVWLYGPGCCSVLTPCDCDAGVLIRGCSSWYCSETVVLNARAVGNQDIQRLQYQAEHPEQRWREEARVSEEGGICAEEAELLAVRKAKVREALEKLLGEPVAPEHVPTIALVRVPAGACAECAVNAVCAE
eukprot:284461-Rhodomonas_salina.1